MVATIKIFRFTGVSTGPTKTDITSTTNRAATDDSAAPGTSDPIPVPTGGGTNYSYWVSTRLSATAAPATAINNIKWYSDGTNSMGTGVALNVATASVYKIAVGTVGTTGSQLTSANYVGLNGPTSDAFAQTSAAPMTVAGSIGSTTGDFGDFVVYQVAVTSTASPGVTPSEQLTFQYNQT